MTFLYSSAEYCRPWKLFSLAVGLALLVAGSIYTPALDWDIPISIIMAGLTYFTAPCSVRTVLERRWCCWPVALLATWFSVDGCYVLYWYFRDPVVLAYMRSANAQASLPLYGICGVIWLYRGSVRDFVQEVQAAIQSAWQK